MGVCCERGEGIPQNLEMAVTWYEQAAREGYAPAQNNLGGCFEQGIGVPEDPLAAVEWFTRASAGGEPNATCRLALCYENGRGVTQNLERAFHLYEDAARHKHPVALYRLGLYYDRGITVNPQVAYAAHLFERAAIAGVGDAAYALALCCREGRGRRRNDRESLEWLREAERLGSVQGAYELGMTRFEGRATVQNRQAALASFEKSAAALSATSPRALKASDKFLPADGISAVQAAGKALYMLGYDAAEHQKYEEALTYLDRAAELGCGEAFTAIGDLYTHGLIGRNDPVLDRTAALEAYEAAAEKKRPEALLSLAKAYEEMAVEDEKQGLTDKAAKKRELAFRCLSRCVKMGSKSALVGMAGCYWFGYGVRRNRDTAYDYLRRANGYTAEEQPQEREENTVAALWLGDLFWSAMETASSVTSKATCAKAARAAYRSAIRAPLGRGENLPYALSVRRKRSEALETRAKAEAHYRLAVLNLLYFKDKLTEREVYGPLGEAVLSQHARALDDLTRLYLFEKQRSSERMAAEAARRPAGLMERLRQGKAKGTQRPESKAAATAAMLADFSDGYYAALRLLPAPFDLAPPAPRASEADLSEDLTRPLSDTQRAEALNRLGDRYFYGKGIAENKTSAVACYRRAAATVQPRGEAVSGGIIWAQYSLGYCLLHGIGTKKDPREAVRWLTSAAKYHGEAALCLAKCHESGVGVDRVDRLEALKFYRRALKFGHKEATEAITVLEAEIKEEAQA